MSEDQREAMKAELEKVRAAYERLSHLLAEAADPPEEPAPEPSEPAPEPEPPPAAMTPAEQSRKYAGEYLRRYQQYPGAEPDKLTLRWERYVEHARAAGLNVYKREHVDAATERGEFLDAEKAPDEDAEPGEPATPPKPEDEGVKPPEVGELETPPPEPPPVVVSVPHAGNLPAWGVEAGGKIHVVDSEAAFEAAQKAAKPGHVLEFAPGFWLPPKGDAAVLDKPGIVYRCRPGQPHTGGFARHVEATPAAHGIVWQDLLLNGWASLKADAAFIRVLNCQALGTLTRGPVVTVTGPRFEAGWCAFRRLRGRGIAFQPRKGQAKQPWVHHCLWADYGPHDQDYAECLQLGQGWSDHIADMGGVFEDLLMLNIDYTAGPSGRANDENEAISIKSRGNLIRRVTVRRSKLAYITARFGGDAVIEECLVRGPGCGFRFFSDRHRLVRSAALDGAVVEMWAGDVTANEFKPGNLRHLYAEDCTAIECVGPIIIGQTRQGYRHPALRCRAEAHKGNSQIGHAKDSFVAKGEGCKPVETPLEMVGPRDKAGKRLEA